MATPPKLTPEERAIALEKAKIARTARAKLKKDIASGKVDLEDVLNKAKSDPIVGKMRVKALIESIPGCGKVKTEKIMRELKISETRRVQGLGVRQAEGLLKMLA